MYSFTHCVRFFNLRLLILQGPGAATVQLPNATYSFCIWNALLHGLLLYDVKTIASFPIMFLSELEIYRIVFFFADWIECYCKCIFHICYWCASIIHVKHWHLDEWLPLFVCSSLRHSSSLSLCSRHFYSIFSSLALQSHQFLSSTPLLSFIFFIFHDLCPSIFLTFSRSCHFLYTPETTSV